MKKAIQLFITAICYHTSTSQTYAITADRLIDGQNDQTLSNPTIIVRQKITLLQHAGFVMKDGRIYKQPKN
jgi:hypothetical protein